MQDADHFNETQKSGHLLDKETNYHCIMRRNERQTRTICCGESKCSQN